MASPSSSPSRAKAATAPRPDPAAVLTKAVLRASGLLGLSNATLARVLGVSEASISRLATGARFISPSTKEGELALLLVRTYRSLDALVGTDAAMRKAWLGGFNRALNAKPIEMIERAEGLVAVASYLDAMRAPS